MAGTRASSAHELPGPVRLAARTGEPDRYVAALLAPRNVQSDLVAIAAFAAEIARIPEVVSDAAIGEIRLAWFREELERPLTQRSGNPVTDALRDTCRRHDLAAGELVRLVDAQVALLYRDPPQDDAHLTDFFAATEGTLFTLAGRIAAPELAGRNEALLDSAGQVYGRARMLLDLRRLHASGRTPLPANRLKAAGVHMSNVHESPLSPNLIAVVRQLRNETRAGLEQLRPQLNALPGVLRIAVLPLALVEPYLSASERSDTTQNHGREQLMPLKRIYRIWAAHAFGRF